MAGKIKGITLEIGGNTEPLDKALKKVNKTAGSLRTELREVERGLKFNPGNAELVAQKQAILSEAIENTTQKLDALKNAQADAEKRFTNGEIDAKEYRKFQRELVKTEDQLRELQSAAKDVDVKATVTADTRGVDKVKSALKELGPAAKQAASEMSDHLKTAGAAGAAAVGGIVIGSTDLNKILARVRTNAQQAGADLGLVEQAFKDIVTITGEEDSAAETLSNLLAAGIKDSDLAAVIDGINGAYIRFSDTLKTEGIADGIQETFATGEAIGPFAELLDRSGVNVEQFNEKLIQAKKTGTETNLLLLTMADAGLMEITEAYRKSNEEIIANAEATFEMQLALADLAIVLTPLITFVTDLITKIVTFAKENETLTTILAVVAGAITAVTGVAMALAPVFTVLGVIATALGTTVGALAAPIAIAIAAIVGLIAIGVALYKNWDKVKLMARIVFNEIKQFISSAMSTVSNNIKAVWSFIQAIFRNAGAFIKALVSGDFQGMRNAISNQMNNIRNNIQNIWSNIRSFMSNINLFGIGKNIMAGLLNGIESMASSIYRKAKEIADGVKNWVKKALKIQSPSRVMMELGEYTGEGFAVGLENMKNSIKNATSELANTTISVASLPSKTQYQNSVSSPQTKGMTIQPAPIYLDGRAIGEATFQVIDSLQGNVMSLRGVQMGV